MTSSPPPQRPGTDGPNTVAAFKAGAIWAFEQVYLERFDDLCNYASTLVPQDDAGDIVHDVLYAIWEARERLTVSTDDDFFYYILRAVRNRAIRVQHQTHSRDRRAGLWETEHEYASSSDDETLADDDRERLITRVRFLIEGLPARAREVLLLRWQHGLNFAQIASLMGVSYGYIRVLHTRALSMVRDRMHLP